MKKAQREPKIRLHRETVQSLSQIVVRQVAGGFVSWIPCATDKDCQ